MFTKSLPTSIAITLALILAAANFASAQLNNTTNGPNAVVTNRTNAGASMTSLASITCELGR